MPHRTCPKTCCRISCCRRRAFAVEVSIHFDQIASLPFCNMFLCCTVSNLCTCKQQHTTCFNFDVFVFLLITKLFPSRVQRHRLVPLFPFIHQVSKRIPTVNFLQWFPLLVLGSCWVGVTGCPESWTTPSYFQVLPGSVIWFIWKYEYNLWKGMSMSCLLPVIFMFHMELRGVV